MSVPFLSLQSSLISTVKNTYFPPVVSSLLKIYDSTSHNLSHPLRPTQWSIDTILDPS